jgi:hypothetical protein
VRAAGLSLILCLSCAGWVSAVAGDDQWRTVFEKSGGTETGRYPETVEFCRRLDAASPRIEYRSFGTSPEGRELPLLLVNAADTTKPLLFVIAGIHSGEIDGKDAGLLLLRDAFVFNKLPGLFDRVRFAFVPILNVDGHERFSAFNRVNQNGPKETGWRTTAQNLNLNRDWLKADAPEMRALLTEIVRLNPDFLMDVHVSDGADYQYVLTYSMNDHENELPPLRAWNRDLFIPKVKQALRESGYDLARMVSFRDSRNPASGWESDIAPPRFSTGYGTVTNRPFFLLETHSLKDYRTRVTATCELLKAVIQVVGGQAPTLRSACRMADSLAASLAGKPYSLNWKLTGDSAMVDFLGVEFHREYSETLGDSVVHWGNIPVHLRIPYFEHNVPTDSVVVPLAYVIPPAWNTLTTVLEVHGVPVRRLKKPVELKVETYRFSHVKFATKPYEGRFRPEFQAEPFRKTDVFPAGSAVVMLDHRQAQVAVHLLEPDGPDSFVRWGFMNQIFEQKEYAEDYVMDTLATRMLRESPNLAAEFEKRLTDSTFARSPEQRRQFFYERSPYWDERKDLCPVGRVVDGEELKKLLDAISGQ